MACTTSGTSTTSGTTFAAWLDRVRDEIHEMVGIVPDDMDAPFLTWYEDGESPRAGATLALKFWGEL